MRARAAIATLLTALLLAACGGQSGSGDAGAGGHGHTARRHGCSGSHLCIEMPAGAANFDLSFGTQDAYAFTAREPPPGGSSPNVWQRLQNLAPGAWRVLGTRSYVDQFVAAISPLNYYFNGGSVDKPVPQLHAAWNFRTLDKELSEAPPGTPKEVDQELPYPLWFCSQGSWTSVSTGCYSTSPSGLSDQTYGQAAAFYANLVRYFRTGVIARGSGTTAYTARTLTDSQASFDGDTGDCVTATVIDADGFPDWVTGAIRRGSGHTATLTASWSTSESFDREDGDSALTRTVPAKGAAYDIAKCTPPGGLSSPQDAVPWPVPPSVGTVQYFELFNEPDLSNYNLEFTNPSLPPPTPALTGVNVPGGTLKAGTAYSYEIASAGSRANETSGGGGLSTASAQQTITLPAGDNAVRINWSATSHDGLTPYAYVIYGRTGGSVQGLAAVGRAARDGLTWTDKGTVTPTGAPSTSDQSAGGNVITPGVYYQLWNAIVPAMKAVDRSVKVSGPVEANAAGYGPPSVDTACVTTNGLGSRCANGDPGWVINDDYIPTLLHYGRPKPDVVTFHDYGTAGADTPEDKVFSSITSYETHDFEATDKAAIDKARIPVWIDESNADAATVGNPVTGSDFRSMTQMGAAWLADDFIQWAHTDSHVQHLVQWAANSNDISYELFGEGTPGGGCVPKPACLNLRKSQPDLEYWSIYELNHLLGPGKLVPVTNVPAGFAALAVQTGRHTVVMVLVNLQQGNDDGNGAAGAVTVQLTGRSVKAVRRTAVNGSTPPATGPRATSLGGHSTVTLNAAGYEVDLLTFKLS